LIVRPDGRFITQREVPAIARIVPQFSGGQLVLWLDAEPHAIDLDQAGEPIEVAIWRDRFSAFAQPAAVDQALSRFLGRPVRLVKFDPTVHRPCSPEVSPPGAHAAFADEFPLLVTSTASLGRLNDALMEHGQEPVPMGRFRPNIVVEGLPAWAEDRLCEIRIGGLHLRLVTPCERCIVTTTDQITGARDSNEPIRTLRMLHADPGGKPLFGWNAVPLADNGDAPILRLGAEILGVAAP
jgi:uncharacterized protein YcbX